MPDPRRNPFEGVTDYFSELGRMRSLGVHGVGGVDHGAEASDRTHASAWVPVTDILARGDDLVIRVELAGVDPDDIDVRLTHGALTITGARRRTSDEDVDWFVRERYYGEFRRVITLPDGTEADQIDAEFGDGLVEITVRDGVTPADSTKIRISDRSTAPVSRPVSEG